MKKYDEMPGVYIHIPFCIKKCNYCDFLSFPGDEITMERYVEALCREIRQTPADWTAPFRDAQTCRTMADTVFIGGGTPSLLTGQQIGRILDAVRSVFTLSGHAEITLEANPKTLTEEKLRHYLEAGVNRLSMGVQSMEEEILKRLGRIHRKEDFLENYESARRVGFSNINTDLMFSLPGLKEAVWERTLSEIMKLAPEHISFYGLIIEEGTPFYEDWKRGLLQEVEDETDRRIYWATVDTLLRHGYEQYEISNAAKPGFRSRHNLKYWSLEPYIGYGLGAHSYINRKRIENEGNLANYMKTMQEDPSSHGVHKNIYENTRKDDMEEFMFTGLRKTKGISLEVFQERFGESATHVYGPVVLKMKNQGLLLEEKGFLFLSKKGVDISNYVMTHFLLD